MQVYDYSALESTSRQHFDKLNVTECCQAELVEALLNISP